MVQNYKNDVILSVEHLKTYFYQKRNQEPIRAVDDVSFQIIRGKYYCYRRTKRQR